MSKARAFTYTGLTDLEHDSIAFWAHITPETNGCWEWCGSADKHGYGNFSCSYNGRRVWISAHRFAYLIANRELPALGINHHCDNPRCANPAHLYAGTQQQNARDRVDRGRQKGGVLGGERNFRAKLTDIEVVRIREEFDTKAVTGKSLSQIGAEFGISFSSVWKIGKRMTWKHLS